MNASRAALIWSALVVGIPCGKPGYDFSVPCRSSLTDRLPSPRTEKSGHLLLSPAAYQHEREATYALKPVDEIECRDHVPQGSVHFGIVAQQGLGNSVDRTGPFESRCGLSALRSRARLARPTEGLPPIQPAAADPSDKHGGLALLWRPPNRNRTLMLVVYSIFQAAGFLLYQLGSNFYTPQGVTVTKIWSTPAWSRSCILSARSSSCLLRTVSNVKWQLIVAAAGMVVERKRPLASCCFRSHETSGTCVRTIPKSTSRRL